MTMSSWNNLTKKLVDDFEIINLGALKYFLGIGLARSKEGIYVAQQKYLLGEIGLAGYKAAETPIEASLKLQPAKNEVVNWEQYQRLMGN